MIKHPLDLTVFVRFHTSPLQCWFGWLDFASKELYENIQMTKPLELELGEEGLPNILCESIQTVSMNQIEQLIQRFI